MPAVFGPVVSLKNILDRLEKLAANKRRMCPLVRLSFPNKQCDVKRVLEGFL